MLKKKEAHPVDAKSFNKPIKEARKKQENTLPKNFRRATYGSCSDFTT
jgi:hypothetical protein